MAYFCFVECEAWSVPHMEPLEAMTPEEARQEALRLLSKHRTAKIAHIYLDDQPICSLPAGAATQ